MSALSRAFSPGVLEDTFVTKHVMNVIREQEQEQRTAAGTEEPGLPV